MDEFLALKNFSCSVPTGVVIGRRWRRARHYHDQDESDPEKKWIIQEYVACKDDPKMATIKNTVPQIIDETETMIRDRLYGKKA